MIKNTESELVMKKGTVIGLALAVLSLIALGALALWLAVSMQPVLSPNGASAALLTMETPEIIIYDEAQAKADAEKAAQEKSSATKVRDVKCEVHEEETEASVSGTPSYIWVGDSRTVGMGKAMDNADIYIGESGEGYYWLNETGLPLIIEAIAEYPELPVIFNFGVNDDENLPNYLVLYQALEEQYPDTQFYYLSVNPIEPTLCTNISNEEISAFNQALKEEYPDTYIDSFTFVMIGEIVTIDGVHYSEDDYRAIYDYTTAQLERMNKTE